MSDTEETYSIQFRVRRVTYEDAYVAVPVTEKIINRDEEDGGRIDIDALVAEAIRISGNEAADWQIEATELEPHPTQAPMPEGRRLYDAIVEVDG